MVMAMPQKKPIAVKIGAQIARRKCFIGTASSGIGTITVVSKLRLVNAVWPDTFYQSPKLTKPIPVQQGIVLILVIAFVRASAVPPTIL